MDWVHCNVCAGRPGQNKMYISTCGHVLCQSCCKNAKEGLCGICKKSLKISEINKNLRSDWLDFFKDPIKTLNDGCAEIRQVVAFQAKQREYFVKFRNFKEKRENEAFHDVRAELMKISQDVERRKKALIAESEQIKKEKERKKQLTERLHSLQREARSSYSSSAQLRLSRTRTEPAPSKSSKFQAPKLLFRRGSHENRQMAHGFLDQSTSKIVTSTPIANIDFSRRDYMNRMFGAGMANPSPILRH